jgi:hypothetical protein
MKEKEEYKFWKEELLNMVKFKLHNKWIVGTYFANDYDEHDFWETYYYDDLPWIAQNIVDRQTKKILPKNLQD